MQALCDKMEVESWPLLGIASKLQPFCLISAFSLSVKSDGLLFEYELYLHFRMPYAFILDWLMIDILTD